VNNFYGEYVPTSFAKCSQVIVSIDSYEITMGKLAEYDLKERATWEKFKTTPTELGLEIIGTDAEGGKTFTPIIAKVNMQTGNLSVGGVSAGTLPENPTDIALTAFDQGKGVVPIIESEVWAFINSNPNKFVWR